MNLPLFSRHYALSTAGRVRSPWAVESSISLAEVVTLLVCGAAAAVSVLLIDFKLKIPGHAIMRAVFPMALGLAIVPRRGAGTIMGAGALATAALLMSGGWVEKGLGSLTSLTMIGPMLDLVMRRAAPRGRIYWSFIAAGVATNLAAFLVQATAKYFGWETSGGGKSLAVWMWPAVLSFPVWGALAGLISAATWFRWNTETSPEVSEDRS